MLQPRPHNKIRLTHHFLLEIRTVIEEARQQEISHETESNCTVYLDRVHGDHDGAEPGKRLERDCNNGDGATATTLTEQDAGNLEFIDA